MYTLMAGLLIPKDKRKRPQRNGNSPEIPLDFPCLTAAFPRNSQVAGYRDTAVAHQKYAFYKTYPMFTSDMRLVICTCDLQVGLL